MSQKSDSAVGAVMGAIFLAAVAVDDGAKDVINSLTQETITITVSEKERVQKGEDSKYLVWTTKANGEEEVFENTDSYWFLKFDSSDVQGALKKGGTYKVDVAGLRLPFFSAYRNIISSKNEIVSVKAPVAPAAPELGQ